MHAKIRNALRKSALTDSEVSAITQTLTKAEVYGYGNLMSWLATAWALQLQDHGLSCEQAIKHVSRRMPYQLQDDAAEGVGQ